MILPYPNMTEQEKAYFDSWSKYKKDFDEEVSDYCGVRISGWTGKGDGVIVEFILSLKGLWKDFIKKYKD